MKYKWKFHPSDYALGENEKFYGEMEERGWRLVKRGSRLSKFRPARPSRARYRVEVSAPAFLESASLPEEQLAVYANSGWEYVTGSGLLHIFRSPEGSGAPEFYQDPRRQAATLKKLRGGILWAWLPIAVAVGYSWMLASTLGGASAASVLAGIRRTWVEDTALLAAGALLLVWAVCTWFQETWGICRTYRRLKKGIALDHNPQGRHMARRIVKGGLAATAAAFFLLAGVQALTTQRRDMPAQAGGPYLTLGDLGWEGERTYLARPGNASEVVYSRSLLARHWDTREALTPAGTGNTVWIYQDVYLLADSVEPLSFVRDLIAGATFVKDFTQYEPAAVTGLDAAWHSGSMEAVAVKGRLVAYLVYGDGGSAGDGLEAALEALAQRWKQA